jgi:rhamnose transport system permease protein
MNAPDFLRRHRREVSVAIAIAALAIVLSAVSPAFFSPENLLDVFLANMPVLVVAIGMTLVVLTGQIDISAGSVFAICGVTAGLLAKADLPLAVVAAGTCAAGVALGALNGALVAYARIPSIVATLATMVALRDGLRWATQGAWIQDLPARFQWLGLSQASYRSLPAALPSRCSWLLAGGYGISPPAGRSTPRARIRTPPGWQASARR